MKRFKVRFTPLAKRQLDELYETIAARADAATAIGYIGRIEGFCSRLDTFPERGSVRDDIRPGLRVIGFERRVSIAFKVQGDEVRIVAVLYAGRQMPKNA